jgi:DNA polymerase-3 subunit epsilon
VSLGRKFIPGHKSYSLGNICKDLDINLVGHHRALNDAMATAELFIKINKARVNTAS